MDLVNCEDNMLVLMGTVASFDAYAARGSVARAVVCTVRAG